MYDSLQSYAASTCSVDVVDRSGIIVYSLHRKETLFIIAPP